MLLCGPQCSKVHFRSLTRHVLVQGARIIGKLLCGRFSKSPGCRCQQALAVSLQPTPPQSLLCACALCSVGIDCGAFPLRHGATHVQVMFSAFGGHAMALEIMDAMFKPAGYSKAYLISWFYIFRCVLLWLLTLLSGHAVVPMTCFTFCQPFWWQEYLPPGSTLYLTATYLCLQPDTSPQHQCAAGLPQCQPRKWQR